MNRNGHMVIIFMTLVLALTISCQKSDTAMTSSQNAGGSTEELKSSTARAGDALRLKKFIYVDSKGTGVEAFSFLMPEGWQFKGGVNWVLDNPVMPATISFTAKSPDGREELEVFPSLAMFSTNNQMVLSTFPLGSRYFGAEVMPLLGPEDALREVVIPRFRGSRPGLKVMGVTAMPELAKALKAGAPQPRVQTFGDAAKARIEYMNDGVLMEEDIFAVVEGYTFQFQAFQGLVTNTNWYVDYLFSYKAPKNGLNASATLFRAMTDSFRISPPWFNTYNQVVDILIKNQLKFIQSMGELSRYISQTNSEISDSMMQSYNERQKIYDRIGEKISQSIRGTENYYNPIEGSKVELPGGYKHVWTNSGGEYILTDSPGYNPNEGSSKGWQEIHVK